MFRFSSSWVLLVMVGIGVPAVAMQRDVRAELRAELLDRYGIRAVDKTDEQSSIVLQNLLFLLKNGFAPAVVRGLNGFRALYAYRGHDDHYDIAGYHYEARAISIGGRSVYPDAAPGEAHSIPAIPILAALAHEIGHAFVLDKMTPLELERVSARFGGWGPVFDHASPVDSFYSRALLEPYPFSREATNFSAPTLTRMSLVSGYASTNVHEWFADAFAAAILVRLGRAKLLGADWQARLVLPARRKGDYWANYNDVSDEFRAWLQKRLEAASDNLFRANSAH